MRPRNTILIGDATTMLQHHGIGLGRLRRHEPALLPAS